MQFVKYYWFHDFSDEPYLFYVELDSARWATRTVEIYKDRRQCYAQEGEECGTFMPEAAFPPNDEINQAAEFKIVSITREEFENVWKRRKQAYEGDF